VRAGTPWRRVTCAAMTRCCLPSRAHLDPSERNLLELRYRRGMGKMRSIMSFYENFTQPNVNLRDISDFGESALGERFRQRQNGCPRLNKRSARGQASAVQRQRHASFGQRDSREPEAHVGARVAAEAGPRGRRLGSGALLPALQSTASRSRGAGGGGLTPPSGTWPKLPLHDNERE
jgi:hypothetical protein